MAGSAKTALPISESSIKRVRSKLIFLRGRKIEKILINILVKKHKGMPTYLSIKRIVSICIEKRILLLF